MTGLKQGISCELRFDAAWPYEDVQFWIDTLIPQPAEEGDFFDLGVWTSESAEIDTTTSPLLTVPYVPHTRNYEIHVPWTSGLKFIGVAPIRKFPYEEVGTLAEIFIP